MSSPAQLDSVIVSTPILYLRKPEAWIFSGKDRYPRLSDTPSGSSGVGKKIYKQIHVNTKQCANALSIHLLFCNY
jgi:hypothetical protein